MLFLLEGLSRETIKEVSEQFDSFLQEFDYNFKHRAGLCYVLRELIHNATKAHIKRIFLSENKSLDPRKIASEFRNALDANSPLLLKKLLKSGLKVKVHFLKQSGVFFARVENDAEMLIGEKEFVERVFTKSFEIESSNEESEENIVTLINDEKREGAGYGLYSSIKILQNADLARDSLTFKTGDFGTIFELRIKRYSP